MSAGQADEDNYRQRLSQDPEDFDACLNLGLLLQASGQLAEAMSCFERCVGHRPVALPALFSLGTIQHAMRNYEDAIESFNRIINAALSGAMEAGAKNLGTTYNNLGNVYRDINRIDDAEICYRQAIKHAPGLAIAFNSLGMSLFIRGEVEDARVFLRKAIAIDPGLIDAHYHLSLCEVRKERDQEVAYLEDLWRKAELPAEQKSALAFTLGRISEQIHEPESAFGYWEAGNRLRREVRPWDCKAHLHRVSLIQSNFDAGLLAGADRGSGTGIVPIFIVGMPRSGSSLVEQILASHSMVHGAGELELLDQLITSSVPGFPHDVSSFGGRKWRELGQVYLEKLGSLSTGKTYVVDKMLRNYQHIGALRLMLPHARIIHCMRDPLDTCLSCFRQAFNQDGLGFTNSLQDLGRVYGAYRRMLVHWNALLPGWIFENSYEALVATPEESIRQLLSFCGLPFEDACMDFHKTRRLVNTASAAQVKRPIYSNSVKYWHTYRRELGELIHVLEEEGVLAEGDATL
jgi:tetratricopeptide (TPR) repeat protein